MLLILCAAVVVTGCNFWPGGPDVSEKQIPKDIPQELRVDILKLFSWNKSLRIEAARSIGRRGKQAEPAIPFLVAMLGDNAIKLEGDEWGYTTPGKAAGWALVEIGDASLDPLYAALIHKDEDIRQGAAWTLGWFKEKPRVVDHLAGTLDDPYWKVRDQATRSRGEIHTQATVQPLVSMLKDENKNIVHIAFDALNTITGKYFGKSPEEWQSWWEKSKKNFIPENEYEKLDSKNLQGTLEQKGLRFSRV